MNNLMVKRLAIAGLMMLALFTAAVRLPAQTCAVASAPIGESCKQACCANKTCCAQAEKNKSVPSVPLVKDAANQDLNAVLAPTLAAVPLVPARSLEQPHHTSAIRVATSAPRPALLCTFLI